jgi:hypothetical protein
MATDCKHTKTKRICGICEASPCVGHHGVMPHLLVARMRHVCARCGETVDKFGRELKEPPA